MESKTYFVYILASKNNGTLYIGITNNLLRQIIEHKEKIIKGFTEKYNVEKLVYYETFNYVNDAIKREKGLKEWNRKWKIMLIEKTNREWKDLLYYIASEEEIKLMRETVLSNAFR